MIKKILTVILCFVTLSAFAGSRMSDKDVTGVVFSNTMMGAENPTVLIVNNDGTWFLQTPHIANRAAISGQSIEVMFNKLILLDANVKFDNDMGGRLFQLGEQDQQILQIKYGPNIAGYNLAIELMVDGSFAHGAAQTLLLLGKKQRRVIALACY